MMTRTILAATLAGLLLPSISFACGGFFCDQPAPRDTSLFDPVQPRVDQTSERIVFAIDKEAGKVETHVQVAYEGSVDEFAWVIPVTGEPELFTSPQALFDTLEANTAPQFVLSRKTEGTCRERPSKGDTAGWDEDAADFDVAETDAPTDSGADPGVQVLAEQEVGPYQTVTLAADTAELLVDWLQNEGFNIPDDAGKALEPYLTGGSNFVALRLGKDKEVGDIVPFGMRYEGTKPQIPIVLTRIAAVEDMRLITWVLAAHRAVPDNYLHVTPNLAALDWWSFGDNWRELIARAADEAGGQAFATDYAGPPPPADGLWSEFWLNETALRQTTNAYDWLVGYRAMGVATLPESFRALERLFPWQTIAPEAGSTERLINCPNCYEMELLDAVFDPEAATDRIVRDIADPRRDAATLLGTYPWVTRLTSSMSPDEMDADPVFVVNRDMTRVDRRRTATEVTVCAAHLYKEDAPRELRIDGGPVVPMPSEAWMDANGWTTDTIVDQLSEIRSRWIDDTADAGDPTPIANNDDRIAAMIANYAAAFGGSAADQLDATKGCGCQTGHGPGAASLLLLGGLAVRRRRS